MAGNKVAKTFDFRLLGGSVKGKLDSILRNVHVRISIKNVFIVCVVCFLFCLDSSNIFKSFLPYLSQRLAKLLEVSY